MNTNNMEPQAVNNESSDESSGETSDGDLEKKNNTLPAEEIEEIHTEGSGDDMDLDETIDTQIGVRIDPVRQHSPREEDDEEPVNILDTLPLEGAPIEGQEVTEADLLGKPLSKDTDDEDSLNGEREKEHCEDEDGIEGKKRHADSENSDPTKKKQKKEDGTEGSASECDSKAEKKLSNMRRNIREVMDETQLDEATLSAQRQEMERLRRVQEQQRIIREVQRQIAINRQNNKAQTRVISLLQGKQNQASTMVSQSAPSSSSGQVRLPSTVLLKVNSATGAGTQTTPTAQPSQVQRRSSTDNLRWQKGRGTYQGAQTSISRVPNRSAGPNMLQQRIRMMTPSVSISPVVPKKEPIDRPEYYSESDVSDLEAEEAMHEQLRKSVSPRSQKPVKGKDVVTISSSSESSDDDCIVLSDPSGEEETDNEDDPSNSGMHTNDRYNVPDEHGRVLINVGHPESEPDVFLAPQVARIIKAHQIGGIRFLYDNIVESIERYKTSSGFGCILAHSMGLGKTLQVASFCDIFFRCTTAKTVLCIMPINTLQNWLAEFNMWLPYEDPSLEKTNNANIKSEPVAEVKSETKEEYSNKTNVPNLSRPINTDPPHCVGQDNAAQPLNIMSENTYTHHNFNPHGMMSNYLQDSLLNKNVGTANPHGAENYQSGLPPPSMYANNTNITSNYDSMKQNINCHNMPIRPNLPVTKYGVDNTNLNNMYAGMDNRVQAPLYSNMDPRSGGTYYPGMETHHPPQIYNNYPGGTYPNYPNQHHPIVKQEQKKETDALSQNVDVSVKKEFENVDRKENNSSITKEENEEKKDKVSDKIKTPFSVDAPFGMELRPRHFRLHILNDSHKTMTARAKVIHEWQNAGGVLLIGYELYRQLSLKKPNKAKRKRGQPFKDTVDVEEEDKNKGLLDEMHTALVSPGPDLVICDEGHRIKNSHASISMALKQMRTKRRIVLTGYPLQNNLLEYWCMVDFVRPNYLGTKSEFCNMFERPIQNGQCIDSTPQDIRLMRYRAHVLHALLEGFVQRRSHSVLQISLPRKEEYILLVRMTPYQRKLYDIFMNQVVKTRTVPNPLKAFAVCCKIWNHPDILYHFLRKRQANEEDDLDLEEAITEKSTPGGKRSKARQGKGDSKKGKKANTTLKNKPAASVQPNASSTASTDNTDGDNSHNTKQNNYPNYSVPVSSSNYSNSTQQNSYPHNYQSFRSDEQNSYYRTDNSQGEYNEFFNNQNQQRFGNQQQFQSFPQTPGYNSSASYSNQQQNYVSNAEQSANQSQRYPPGQSTSDFRQDQAQNNTYENSNIFSNQPYPYQDQDRNFSPSLNQGSNYSQTQNQSSQFQPSLPSQPTNISISEYSSYGSTNTSQNYAINTGQPTPAYTRNDNQPISSSSLNYANNPHNQNQTSQNSGYHPNQQVQNPPPNRSPNFTLNQQSQNLGIQNAPHNYQQPNQQSQAMSVQGQTHNYGTQLGPNPPNQTTHGFNQQTPQNQVGQGQSHGFIPNSSNQTSISSNQIRYPPSTQTQSVPSNPTNYQTGSSISSGTNGSTQSHNYPVDQQNSTSNIQNGIHGYGHIGPPPTSHSETSNYPSSQQNQSSQQPGQSHSYPSNHQGTPAQLNSGHRYGTNQSGPNHQSQNQSVPYSQNPSSQNSSASQNDQIYSRHDSQQPSQNYSGSNTPHEFPADRQSNNNNTTNNTYSSNQSQTQNSNLSNYSSENNHQNPVTQIKTEADPYWQRNYNQSFRSDQCNESYYRDSNVNRYHNNYFPSQNYSQNYEYAVNHNPDITSRSDEVKSQSAANNHVQNSGSCDKPNKEMSTGIAVQNHSMHQNISNNTPIFSAESNCQNTPIMIPRSVQNINSREDEREKDETVDKDKEDKSDDEILIKDEEKECKSSPGGKEDPGIPYDWATELMKGYVPGLIDASAKMTLFFCILEEAIRLGDRVLAFSQSLFTLNLIEDFLARNSLKHPDGRNETWIKNVNYYRLDGSTTALEREKLINEFNSNSKIHLFLVSTRAGSLGINLVGANRAIVFDASWNPCHDTQAVCRVYRYGQQKPCFVYRLVTDNCLERKIYDRQISKQGMADRVVDQCNPDAHLSLKDATTLSWDWEEDSQVQDFSQTKDSYSDEVMHRVLERHSSLLTKQPFHHESLLVDRKDKKLSQAEKRLARRGYELEKMAANCSRPSYNYVPGNTATRAGALQIRAIRGGDTSSTPKPVASVRPMQQRGAESLGARNVTGSRWIPAEVWQRQGMSAQEMTLPLDVVIPTNSPDKGSIVLKAGQRVMVLKSPKGIYMQLESGKIIAIRTALKLNQQKREEEPKKGVSSVVQRNTKSDVGFPLRNNSAISIIPKSSSSNQPSTRPFNKPGNGPGYRPFADKEVSKRQKPVATATAKPYLSQGSLINPIVNSKLSKIKQDTVDNSNLGENSNSSDGQLRTEQQVEEVRLEDVVAEVGSNPEYSPGHNRVVHSDTDSSIHKSSEENTQVYQPDNISIMQKVQTQQEQSEIERSANINKCLIPNDKDFMKSDSMTNYTNAFKQKDKNDKNADDVIVEETSKPTIQPMPLPPPPTSSISLPPVVQPSPPTTIPSQQPPQVIPPSMGSIEASKSLSNSSNTVISVCASTNTSASKIQEPMRETAVQESSTTVPQGYPYAQYPRYYEYSDPRSRSLPNPYGSYFPAVPTHASSTRLPTDAVNPQSEVNKPIEERITNVPSAYSHVSSSTAKSVGSTTEARSTELTTVATTTTVSTRNDTHVPTAFTHPTSSRYPAPYPPGPYDPYTQHYPAPGSTTAYPPTGAPGYPAYGGPTYNTDYARMYSAFHGPPPTTDPYMHRGYAPPTSHPSNYYPPFPHPPPPYPNYSFLPPYPNPNMTSEPQPPTQ